MKIIFISDIHGSYTYLKKAIAIFEKEQADRLVILGDVLYHGPRNPLPEGYDCIKVANLLNQYSDKIIAVRGNCDAEVDQMLLNFDSSQDYQILDVDGHHFFFTHGHIYDSENLPKLKPGDIFVHGHFHKPMAKKQGDIYILNPSSISLAKEGVNSYGIYENSVFTIKDFNNNEYKTIQFNHSL